MASINDLAAAAIATSSSQGEHARGALVALEGLDRSGKTTQVKLLEQRFVEAGRKVKVMRFPGGCPFFVHVLHVVDESLGGASVDEMKLMHSWLV